MVDEYIKRSDCLEAMKKAEKWWWNAEDLRQYYDLINSIPAADVAPPIRCAECRYFRRGGNPEGFGWCDRPGAGCSLPENYYCKYGTKKEADNG